MTEAKASTMHRPSSAMAKLTETQNVPSASNMTSEAANPDSKESWLKRNFMGRTPSLPSSLGKKKPSFLKKFHCRKISAPTFASTLRHLRHRDRSSSPLSQECDCPVPASSVRSTSFSSVQNQPQDEIAQITSIEEARSLVETIRAKYQCRGRQIIAYRKKLHQQRCEMRQAEAEHQRKLEGISLELMLFESALRAKEKQIETTLATKDQVILKQQKLIKKLLRRRGSSNDFLEGNSNIVKASSGEAKVVADKNRPDYEALNDSSDSAIISDCCQVVESLPVPTLPRRSQKEVPSVPPAAPEIVETKTAETDKNRKEERQRISNRQKLLLLKRHHSGFLKRPEILETVYSVEEDGGELQLTENKPQTQQQTPLHQPRRLSSSSAPLRRTRLDSDFNSDYSTDDESTRLMFSETETACSCSQSCSRRSSWGKCCLVTASAPASRRSSCGSMFNRVMSNHRHVVTPQDVKYKRINKVKSKSLEELRGKLKESTRSSSTNDEDIEDLEEDFSGPRPSRLHLLRQQQRSFSLDQESTDASTN